VTTEGEPAKKRRLPLRERVLNAFAAGFSVNVIAQRLGCARNTVRCHIYEARKAGDPRAPLISIDVSTGRKRSAHSVRWREMARSIVREPGYDQFPDLPEVYDWGCLRPVPTTVDETVFDGFEKEN
jgi:hypothetical protein